MSNTVIGVYDDDASAKRAYTELTAAGIADKNVRTVSPQDMRDGKTRSDYQDNDQSMGEKVSDFFSSMFGSNEEDKVGSRYLEAVRRGATLVIVDADNDKDVDRAESIMTANKSTDIDQRGKQWSEKGWSAYDENSPVYDDDQVRAEREAMGGERTLTETQEELNVGKTRKDAGKVKVFRRVDEENVSESVDLTEKRAKVTRRAVDRPLGAGDMDAFKEGSIEVKEYTEEPVVEKKAHVTGEVDVSAEKETHTETVSDTVRSTTVDVDDSTGRKVDQKRKKADSEA